MPGRDRALWLAGSAVVLTGTLFVRGGAGSVMVGVGALIWTYAGYSSASYKERYSVGTRRLFVAVIGFMACGTIVFGVLILLR